MKQITIDGIEYNLVPVEKQEKIFICEINGKKYYLGTETPAKVSWDDAKFLAASQGGELMSREVAIMAYKNPDVVKHLKTDEYYWLSDECASCPAGYSWLVYFYSGAQFNFVKTTAAYVHIVFVE